MEVIFLNLRLPVLPRPAISTFSYSTYLPWASLVFLQRPIVHRRAAATLGVCVRYIVYLLFYRARVLACLSYIDSISFAVLWNRLLHWLAHPVPCSQDCTCMLQ